MQESGEEDLGLDPSPRGRDPAERKGKIFAGGLAVETTEEKLKEHFEKYGELLEVAVMRDRGTGRPRGFGFVTFKDPTVVDRVVQDIHSMDGRQIDVKKSVPQEQKAKARKIFVGGLAPETTEDDFKEYFERYGEVAEVQIMQDHMSGRSRGFGFVTFEEDSSAERVFASGAMHELGGKRVEVKPATPKGTGSQLPRVPGTPPSGRSNTEYSMGMSYVSSVASPYAYGLYGYPRPGMVTATPYGMQYPAIPPYMMMQPSVPGYGPSSMQGYSTFSGPGRGGVSSSAIPFSSTHVQPQHMHGGLPSPTSPYHPGAHQQGRSKSGGRGKVDSASSLDQHAQQQLRKLSLD